MGGGSETTSAHQLSGVWEKTLKGINYGFGQQDNLVLIRIHN